MQNILLVIYTRLPRSNIFFFFNSIRNTFSKKENVYDKFLQELHEKSITKNTFWKQWY